MIGSAFGTLYVKLDKPQDIGHLFGVIDIEKMIPLPSFKERLAQMIREVKATPLAAGATAIYAPGEIEAGKKARRLVEGIQIPDGVKREFEETAAELGISFP